MVLYIIYAYDTTRSFCNLDYDILISTWELEALKLIQWFKINKMQANPDKCQVLAVGKKTFNKNPYFTIEDHWKMSKSTLKERDDKIQYL